MAQDVNFVPIPGTKKVRRLEENATAIDIELSSAELDEINVIFPPDAASGPRYPAAMMSSVGR